MLTVIDEIGARLGQALAKVVRSAPGVCDDLPFPGLAAEDLEALDIENELEAVNIRPATPEYEQAERAAKLACPSSRTPRRVFVRALPGK
jgi:hypothetical protein